MSEVLGLALAIAHLGLIGRIIVRVIFLVHIIPKTFMIFPRAALLVAEFKDVVGKESLAFKAANQNSVVYRV